MSNVVQISEKQLARLIPRFYKRVRNDKLNGPVLNAAIGDWGAPSRKACRFLVIGDAHGRPLQGQFNGGASQASVRHHAADVRSLAGALGLSHRRGVAPRHCRASS